MYVVSSKTKYLSILAMLGPTLILYQCASCADHRNTSSPLIKGNEEARTPLRSRGVTRKSTVTCLSL